MKFTPMKFKNFFHEELDTEGIDDLSEIFLYENRVLKRKIPPRLYAVINKSLKFDLPPPGYQLEIRTQAQLNMVGLVLKAVQEYKIIEELWISTYSIIQPSFDLLIDLYRDEVIQKFNLIICESFRIRFPATANYIKQIAQILKFNCIFVHNHAKITLIRAGENFLNIRGSMNYSLNSLGEQLTIENSKDVFDWDREFIQNIIVEKNKNLKRTEIVHWE